MDKCEIILIKKKNIIYKKSERTKKNRKTKNECACGGRYTNANKKSHHYTQLHKKYLETISK